MRVDIDEQDLPYFLASAQAVATLKGRPQVRFPLTYFDTEPYVIPKQSLTGSNTERVDTRVLQVLYALPEKTDIPLYIGQQMDIYIEAAKPPGGVVLDADPTTAKRPFEDEPPRAAGAAGRREERQLPSLRSGAMDRQPWLIGPCIETCDRCCGHVERARLPRRPADDAKGTGTRAIRRPTAPARSIEPRHPRASMSDRLRRDAGRQVLGDDLDGLRQAVLALDGHGDLRRLPRGQVEPVGRQRKG